MESFSRSARAIARLERADGMRASLDELARRFDDASNAERGYVATEDTSFRDAYFDAASQARVALATARRSAEESQRADFDALDGVVDELEAVMTQGVRARSSADLHRVSDLLERLHDIAKRILGRADALAQLRLATAITRRHWEIAAYTAVVASFAFASALVIRQRRRDEQRRRQAEQRAALVDVMDQFIGVLGHDLRNPAGASLMGAKILAARRLAQPDALIVERIRSSNERMLRLIDDLLDLARSRLGPGIPVVRTRCDLRDIVSNVVDEIRTRYPDRQIRWDWRGDGLGMWDDDRMAQVVSNLVGNAVEHGDGAKPVDVRLVGDAQRVSLEVHNYGAPIAEESLPTLFRSYKHPTSNGHGGLGLGLFIADQIVKAHLGELRVRSSAEEGTTFTATFAPRALPS